MSFLGKYDAQAGQPAAQVALVSGWLRTDARPFFAELRAQRPVLATPAFTLLSRFDDVERGSFAAREDFSVRLIRRRRWTPSSAGRSCSPATTRRSTGARRASCKRSSAQRTSRSCEQWRASRRPGARRGESRRTHRDGQRTRTLRSPSHVRQLLRIPWPDLRACTGGPRRPSRNVQEPEQRPDRPSGICLGGPGDAGLPAAAARREARVSRRRADRQASWTDAFTRLLTATRAHFANSLGGRARRHYPDPPATGRVGSRPRHRTGEESPATTARRLQPTGPDLLPRRDRFRRRAPVGERCRTPHRRWGDDLAGNRASAAAAPHARPGA